LIATHYNQPLFALGGWLEEEKKWPNHIGE